MRHLALSHREAAAALGVDRGTTLRDLIAAGRLREVPWGVSAGGRPRTRIPAEDVERVAREGFVDPACRAPRARSRRGHCDPDALSQIDLTRL